MYGGDTQNSEDVAGQTSQTAASISIVVDLHVSSRPTLTNKRRHGWKQSQQTENIIAYPCLEPEAATALSLSGGGGAGARNIALTMNFWTRNPFS